MTTGELLKLMTQFFKTHTKAKPINGDFIESMEPNRIRCCGLAAAYLQANGVKKELEIARQVNSYDGPHYYYDPEPRIRKWLDSVGIDNSWRSGFIAGFDGEGDSCAYLSEAEQVKYLQGYKAGRATAKRLGLLQCED